MEFPWSSQNQPAPPKRLIYGKRKKKALATFAATATLVQRIDVYRLVLSELETIIGRRNHEQQL
jgi:hypothetical protein